MSTMTKKTVDAKAMAILNQSGLCEKEKHLRYFGIGRMYYQIREFQDAKIYFENYLKAETDPTKLADAYRILAITLEHLNDQEGALRELKALYNIQPNRATLNKICDLLETGYGQDETPETKSQWYERRRTAKASGIVNNSLHNSSFTSTPPGVNGHRDLAREDAVLYSPLNHLPSPASKLTNGTPHGAGAAMSSPKFRTPKFQTEQRNDSSSSAASSLNQIMSYMKSIENEVKVNKVVVELEVKQINENVAGLNKKFDSKFDQISKDISSVIQKIDEITLVQSKQRESFEQVLNYVLNSEQKKHQETAAPVQVPAPVHVPAPVKVPAPVFPKSAPVKELFKPAPVKELFKPAPTPSAVATSVSFLSQTQVQPATTGSSSTFSFSMNSTSGTSLTFPVPAIELKQRFQEMDAVVDVAKPVSADPGVESVAFTEISASAQKPLSELFKKPEGSWTCSGCYMSNTKEQIMCPSCETRQPGTEGQTLAPSADQTKFGSGANFGPSPLSFPFNAGSASPNTFGLSSNINSSTGTTAAADSTNKSSAPAPFSFASSSASFQGFGDLAKQNTTLSGFSFAQPSQSTSIFSQPPKPIFGLSTQPQTGSGDTNTPADRRSSTGRERRDSDAEDDFVPTAEFAPVIPLPALVEIVRGDEDENTLFEIRAKLFRFDSEKSEWKERGLGNIKILQNKTDKNKARIVMWREQIHKLACNHWIQPDMTIDYHQKSQKNLKWTCMDFSEGDPKSEIFVCKFGKEELAEEFKKRFQEMVAVAKQDSADPGAESVTFKEISATASASAQKPLSELFKKPEGSWTCSGCYMSNTKEQIVCPSCETRQPGTEEQTLTPAADQTKFGSGANFGPSPLSFSFNSGSGTGGSVSPNTFGLSSSINSSTGTTAASDSSNKSSATAPFSFASGSASFQGFGDLAKQNSTLSGFSFAQPSQSTSIFSQPPKPIFGLSTQPQTGSGDTNTPADRRSSTGRERRDSDAEDDFVPTAEFAPVIPLPALVEIVRGDEDENTLFEIRAKLFRFDSEKSEWKERGLGNIKILQNKTDKNKARVVMWREQIHKLACNHWIQPDMTIDYHQKSQKNLKWTCMDFSEGDPKSEIFVCKFGKEEQAEEFKKRFQEMVAVAKQDSADPGAESVTFKEISATASASAQKPLSELFKKPEGSWTCSGCYMSNTKEQIVCPSCETRQPGTEEQTLTPAADQTKFGSGANFGPSPLSFSFNSGSGTGGSVSPNTFGLSSSINSSTGTTAAADSSNKSSAPAPFSFASGLASFQGFGDLAKQNSTLSSFSFAQPSQSTTSIFSQPPKPIFGSSPQAQSGSGDTNTPTDRRSSTGRERRDSDAEDDFVPTAEFAPVIPLPALVEIVRGDEDENTLFEIRAKLLRFDSEKSEWKERGLGKIKILQNKTDKNKARIVMWREQIHKLACNHWIQPDMTIDYHQKSQKNLKWTCMDFSEGDPKSEIFVCKFGKEEQAEEFKKRFQEMVAVVDAAKPGSGDTGAGAIQKVLPVPTVDTQKPLSELFKKAEGSWTCSGCYLSNTKEQTICPSCETPQPGAVIVESKPAFVAPSSQFSFGFKPALPTKPQTEAEEGTSCPGCIGCDPDSFDFTKLDNRTLPTYPEHTMTPEEFNATKQELKKIDFSSFSFNNPNTQQSGTSSTFPALFTPFQFQPSASNTASAPFTFASNIERLQPESGFSIAPQIGAGAYGGVAGAVGGDADDDVEDEEDEDEPMYEGRANVSVRYPGEQLYRNLGEGQISLTYDAQLYCSRFNYFTDEDEMLIDHVVASDTDVFSIGENTYAWSGLTETEDGGFTKIEIEASFVSEEEAGRFMEKIADSQEIAGYAGVNEAYLKNEGEEEEAGAAPGDENAHA